MTKTKTVQSLLLSRLDMCCNIQQHQAESRRTNGFSKIPMSIQTPVNFDALPLHDAVLKELRFDWATGVCVAELVAFTDGLQKPSRPAKLVWNKTGEVVVSRRSPWGSSVCVNCAREEVGWFVLEMQSGDMIRITAESFEFL